jgi:hypothetical protein
VKKKAFSTEISTNVENSTFEGPHLFWKVVRLCRPDERRNLAYGVGGDKKKFSPGGVGAGEEDGSGAAASS